MTIYLRVHPDPSNYDVFDYDSSLYDTRLNKIAPEELQSSDVIYRMTPAQWTKFRGLVPDGMYFRVYPDKSDTDVRNGIIYDEDFEYVEWTDIPKSGNFLVIPVTEEELTTFETLGGA